MRGIADLTIIDPCDATELRQVVRAVADIPGTVYVRLLRGNVPVELAASYRFVPGAGRPAPRGRRLGRRDLHRLPDGTGAGRRRKAAEAQGIDASVLHVPTIKPFDTAAVLEFAGRHERLVVAENHKTTGGLATLVTEAMFDAGLLRPMVRVGLADGFFECGSQEYLEAQVRPRPAAPAARPRRRGLTWVALRAYAGPLRYLQGPGALDPLGELVAPYGPRPVVVTDAVRPRSPRRPRSTRSAHGRWPDPGGPPARRRDHRGRRRRPDRVGAPTSAPASWSGWAAASRSTPAKAVSLRLGRTGRHGADGRLERQSDQQSRRDVRRRRTGWSRSTAARQPTRGRGRHRRWSRPRRWRSCAPGSATPSRRGSRPRRARRGPA